MPWLSKQWRACAAIGSGLFALSFFLPRGFHNSPFQIFQMLSDSLRDLEDETGLKLAFIGALIAISFAYVCAGLVAISLAMGVRADHWGRRMVMSCYSFGGAVIMTLGIVQLLHNDTWPSASVRWYAAIAPVTIVGGMWIITSMLSLPKRLPVLLLMVMGMQAPLQFVLAFAVGRYHGEGWGYAMGGVGALVVIVAAVGGLCLPGNDTD